ncbi:MAG: dockerin type I domain-containing protein [Candidatus Poribacteria bacterium]|nr:dockerin type I domain-containing protein [Candidatus Poribacteria bacterium]
MNRFFFSRRPFSSTPRFKRHASVLIVVLFLTLLINPTFGQTEVQDLAVVINALTHPDLGITASLSLIDLMEPNERRAVDNEILHFSNEVLQRRRAVGLAIRGHLAYIPTFNLPVTGAPSNGDNIFIINLEAREIVGEIPIQAGATPQQIVFINDQKLYVTCAAAHEVHVVDIPNRNVTKVLTGAFNKPTGITLLNGKAYVSNPAWEWDPEARKTTYYQSTVTVIDTETDIILESIPVPTNAGQILNDGESTVIVKSTGNYNDITGYLVLIDATTDEITETVKLGFTPGSAALNSEKQLFMQGSWQNPGLLIYDVAAQDWIRDEDDTIANFSNDADAPIGGGLTFSPDGNLYITKPDWGGGGQDYVRVMDVMDASLLQTYHVGPGASILAFAQVISRREDLNNDGFINAEDLTIASRFLGDQGPGIIADVNGDEVVNILDLVLIGQAL